MIKAVIFDLDGTLAYTLEDLRTGMNLMLEEMGYPLRTTQDILDAVNCGSIEFVRKSLPVEVQGDEELVKKCHACYAAHYTDHYLDKTILYDGIEETVLAMKAKGLKLAVLSNKSDGHTNDITKKLFPDNTFDHIQGFKPEFPTKPDPTSALYITEKFGCKPNEILYVGDSNVDMETARNAGFFACGCTWGYRSVDILIESGAMALVNKAKELLALI